MNPESTSGPWPEAQLPRVEDVAIGEQVSAAGNTPTRTGDWISELLIVT